MDLTTNLKIFIKIVYEARQYKKELVKYKAIDFEKYSLF